jgi:hypothetical protein
MWKLFFQLVRTLLQSQYCASGNVITLWDESLSTRRREIIIWEWTWFPILSVIYKYMYSLNLLRKNILRSVHSKVVYRNASKKKLTFSCLQNYFTPNGNSFCWCEILGSHGGEYENDSFLRCSAVKSCWSRPTFQRCVIPSSPWRWRQYAPNWRRLHGATSQKAVIWIMLIFSTKTANDTD